MNDINLLQDEQKSQHGYQVFVRPSMIILAGVLLVSLLSCGILALIEWKISMDEKAIDQKIRTYAALETEKKDIQVKQEKIDQMSSLIKTVVANTTINTHILDGVAGVMPENVFMLNYSVDKSGNLNLVGKSKDMNNIAYFVYKLKGTGLFTDVSLTNINNTKGSNSNSGADIYDFTAVLKLKR